MSTRIHVLAVLLILVAVPCAAAQQEGGGSGESPLAKDWTLKVEPGSTFVRGGDLEGASDSVDLWSQRVRFEFEGPAWIASQVTFGASFEHRHYDFHGTNTFLAGTSSPFTSVHSVGGDVTLLQGLSRSWGALLSVGASAAAASGGDLGDAVTWRAIGGVGHQFTEDFQAGIGIGIIDRFARTANVFPVIQLRWKLDDAWTFSVRGPGAELTYRPNQEWEFGFGGLFDGERFRLDDDAVGGEAIVEDRRLPVYLRARHSPCEDVDLEVRAGVDVFRQFRVEDRRGNNGRTWRADPGPFVGVALTLRF